MEKIKSNVSVVIPVHRWGEFVVDAISSVQRQTLQPYEIIVVNDGAGESVSKPLQNRFENITLVNLIDNQGEACARNAGVDVAQGEWIAFLDSDDIWLDDKLAHQVAALDKNKLWDGCYTGATVFDEAGDKATFCDKPHLLTVENSLYIVHALPSSWLIRREDYQSLMGFNRDMPYAGDYDFLLRYIVSGKKMGFVDKPLLKFRREGHGNISSNWRGVLRGKTKMFIRNRRIFFRYEGFLSVATFYGYLFSECSSKMKNTLLKKIFWQMAVVALKIGGKYNQST